MTKKVFVSGCYDLLHSGHIEFFRQAAQYGDLYVGIGSDETILHYKNHKTLYPEQERLFMVKAIRYVKDAFINDGHGVMDFVDTVERLKPDVFVVNEDGSSEEKRRFCEERGIEYVVLQRTPSEGLEARSSTSLKQNLCEIPTRLDIAGTWIDQPYVSCFAPGWPNSSSASKTTLNAATASSVEHKTASASACQVWCGIITTNSIGPSKLKHVKMKKS